MKKTFSAQGMAGKIGTVFLGNAAGASLNFLGSVIAARMLDMEGFGRYSYLYASGIIVLTIFDFSAGTSFVICQNRSGRGPLAGNYNAARLLASLLLAALFASSFLWPGAEVFTFGPAGRAAVFLFALFSLWLAHLQFYEQAAGNYRAYSLVLISGALLRAAFFAALALWRHADAHYPGAGIIFGAAVLAQAAAFFFWFFLYRLRGQLKWNVSFRFDRKFGKTLLLLGLNNSVIVLAMRADNFIIGHYLGFRDVALYNAAFALCMVFPLITASLTAVFIREFSTGKNESASLRAFLSRQLKILAPALAAALLFSLLARPLAGLLFGGRYAEAAPLLSVMVFPFSIGVVFTPLESFFYAESPGVITGLKSVQLAATVFFSIWFVKLFGLIGIGLSGILVKATGWVFLPLYLDYRIGRMKANGSQQALSPAK
ncbi:MAG: oligosaccharide flippase family protein [Nitrospiraceae bacterium]|nr:oligosaccharide flippase family protein [Nitrospiraceae bacterium]